jgi:heme exporter protein A
VSEAVGEATVGERSAASERSAEPAIEVDGLVRRFGERVALGGVSVRLARGETLAVFGPNGAGKTTLLRVLATLLLPQGGSVRVLGRELPRDVAALRSEIGLLAHDPLLYRELSARENLRFYARLYAVDEPEERISELLEATRMSGRADEPVRDLSRGMVQRLAVCRAVLHRPSLLLLDEPRANLDPDATELVEPLIGHVRDHTRVLVTHEVERGLAECDRVLGLRDGSALLEAPAHAVGPAQVRALYGRDGSAR